MRCSTFVPGFLKRRASGNGTFLNGRKLTRAGVPLRSGTGRSVTDPLATLQELEHLGVGFVSLTEALDLTTPAGRAMAGLLAVFAASEREILGERTRAGLARENGETAGPVGNRGGFTLRTSGSCIELVLANRRSLV